MPISGGGGYQVISAVPPNPLQILGTNLLAWYRADTGVTLSGSNVTQWDDQSGNAYHLTVPGGINSPQYSATSFNSRPGITFSTSGTTGLQKTSFAPGAISVTSAFLVGTEESTTGSNARFISYKNVVGTDTDTDGVIWHLSPTLTTIRGFQGATGFLGSSGTLTDGIPYRLGSIYDGVNHTIYVNNVAQTPAGANAFTLTSSGTLGIGQQGGLDSCSSVMAEIVITKSNVGSSDRTSLDTWFKYLWGLS